jgi:hypothetical protein
VTFFGRFGGIARGIVFGAAGLFLLIAPGRPGNRSPGHPGV